MEPVKKQKMKTEMVILVDDNDNETGVAEKLEAHLSGQLHRAISVFIFNTVGQWLIQKRAANKYHSAGLWTNACCSHPRPGEEAIFAAHRRLREEMGIASELAPAFTFEYRAEFENALVEHELDHVFIGHSDAVPQPDPNEVSEWKYISTEELASQLASSPMDFSAWFRIVFSRVRERIDRRRANGAR